MEAEGEERRYATDGGRNVCIRKLCASSADCTRDFCNTTCMRACAQNCTPRIRVCVRSEDGRNRGGSKQANERASDWSCRFPLSAQALQQPATPRRLPSLSTSLFLSFSSPATASLFLTPFFVYPLGSRHLYLSPSPKFSSFSLALSSSILPLVRRICALSHASTHPSPPPLPSLPLDRC